MKKNKSAKVIILLLLAILLTNCDHISDCITAIKPNLISKVLNTGNVAQSYNDNITFEMANANDSDYLISDVSIDGTLPPNINYSVLNNNTIVFSGYPNTWGNYQFTVKITVRPYNYNPDGSDDMCGNVSSKKYEIIIN
jgi:hypothetical protein